MKNIIVNAATFFLKITTSVDNIEKISEVIYLKSLGFEGACDQLTIQLRKQKNFCDSPTLGDKLP